jgi:putative redox protein
MPIRIDCEYLGDLRVRAVHGSSGTVLHTDAPVDNHGKGESFSPTDLAATALATCMATIMAIQGRTLGIELRGMRLSVEKHMTAQPPRRIEKLLLIITPPAGVPADARLKLERAAAACPVHHSLHPEITTEIEWRWGA